jgi:nitrate/TMAO reductase-like tetraheme cytochrome c subunit
MKQVIRSGFLALLTVGAMGAGVALAGDHRYTAPSPMVKAECGSCHIAYPPQLLPARSWRALMAGLDKHFGTDASLDPQTAATITVFLEQNAGRERSSSAQPVLRISETRWFVHEHDEVPGDVWKSPKVKSPSNCAACHSNAEQGDFSEHSVHIPK